MTSFLPLHRSLAAVGLLALAAAGCSVTTGAPADKVTFGYTSLGPVDIPLAVGATDGISVSVPAGTAVSRAEVSDPSVMRISGVSGSAAYGYTIPIVGQKPGTVTLTVYGDTQKEIAHVSLQVAATTNISFDGAGAVAVLEGQSYAVHATTLGAGGVTLAGTGAIAFAYHGAISSGDHGAISSGGGGTLCFGDCGGFFAATPGDGVVTASAANATAELAVHVVPRSAIDSVVFSSPTMTVAQGKSSLTAYTLRASGETVHVGQDELQCASSNPSVASVDPESLRGAVEATVTGLMSIEGHAAGTATVTCTMGALQATIAVTVP